MLPGVVGTEIAVRLVQLGGIAAGLPVVPCREAC